MSGKKVPGWLTGLLVAGTFMTLLWLERRPLRKLVEPKARREARNLAVAALSAVAIRVAEQPVSAPRTALVEQRRWGLLKPPSLPTWLEVPLAVALLDYTLYLWHVLTHKVPLLWRFHQPHHVDLDLDASTALRFHFGEMVLSVPWRAAQILVLGVSPLSLSAWQTATLLEVMFRHSDVELPFDVERRLCRLIATPRMHAIHRSIVPEETGSNWSSGLTVWDWLYGTLLLGVSQGEITIGVPAYRGPEEVTLPQVLAMPFEEQRDSWRLSRDGTPCRPLLPIEPSHLLSLRRKAEGGHRWGRLHRPGVGRELRPPWRHDHRGRIAGPGAASTRQGRATTLVRPWHGRLPT
jgi:sterol desaturase/sphingolipid hydroxylase (fatty acid hydroxylase superfamily)